MKILRCRIIMFLGLVAFTGVSRVFAHPGIGIVQDSKGNIFYTDLVHVWKVSPDGKKSIAVKNVHTHELRLDKQDNLYGENSQYSGEKTNTWSHYIWKRSPDGTVSDLYGKIPGFREDHGFVHDNKGNQYLIRYRGQRSEICRRTPNGSLTILKPDKPIERISWLALSPDEKSIYLSGSSGFYKMSLQGHIKTLLHKQSHTRHALMGIWPDKNGDVYVADLIEQVVKRIEPDGKVSIAARTASPWAPTGFLIATDKSFWLLECSATNEVRVRKVDTKGKVTIF